MSYSDQIKQYVEQYQNETGNAELDPHAIAEWAFKRGLHKPNATTVIDAIAQDISQQFRQEFRVDSMGRRYRAKHARRVRGQPGLCLWGDMDDPNVAHEHFVESFAQRRRGIVGNCEQLATDAAVYNDKRQPEEPINIPFDFTLDVEELKLKHKRPAAALAIDETLAVDEELTVD